MGELVFTAHKIYPKWDRVSTYDGHYVQCLPYQVKWSTVCSHGYFMEPIQCVVENWSQITCILLIY